MGLFTGQLVISSKQSIAYPCRVESLLTHVKKIKNRVCCFGPIPF